MVNDTLDKINHKMRTLQMQNQVICTFYVDDKITSVCIDIKENEKIGVCFENGYVVVRTQFETKFVCKGKAFISLWR